MFRSYGLIALKVMSVAILLLQFGAFFSTFGHRVPSSELLGRLLVLVPVFALIATLCAIWVIVITKHFRWALVPALALPLGLLCLYPLVLVSH